MTWEAALKEFATYLKLERSLSPNSIAAYQRDVEKLTAYLQQDGNPTPPLEVKAAQIENMMAWLYDLQLSPASQARILSGLKTFYRFLIVSDYLDRAPTDFMETPKQKRKIPDVLTVEEIDTILNSIDLSNPRGQRNRAILELLYACGLRVTELCQLKISNVFRDINVISVVGKGDRERLVPIGEEAMRLLGVYIDFVRVQELPKKGFENIVFLNGRGAAISRIQIFLIIKSAVEAVGIEKSVSPHTFRHSFATHLVEGGADLRVVQDLLGHSSITTTEIYTHIDTDYLRETIQTFHPREIQRRERKKQEKNNQNN
ncbi:MAG: hypothetical protein RL757_2670 [Bacteroidota bacterium]|jgi:integrase/recombinase XerD